MRYSQLFPLLQQSYPSSILSVSYSRRRRRRLASLITTCRPKFRWGLLIHCSTADLTSTLIHLGSLVCRSRSDFTSFRPPSHAPFRPVALYIRNRRRFLCPLVSMSVLSRGVEMGVYIYHQKAILWFFSCSFFLTIFLFLWDRMYHGCGITDCYWKI